MRKSLINSLNGYCTILLSSSGNKRHVHNNFHPRDGEKYKMIATLKNVMEISILS